jgi:hypothetical protein
MPVPAMAAAAAIVSGMFFGLRAPRKSPTANALPTLNDSIVPIHLGIGGSPVPRGRDRLECNIGIAGPRVTAAIARERARI